MRGVFVSDRQPGPVAPLSSWAAWAVSAPRERPPAIPRIRPAGRRTSGLSNGARLWCATIWTAACWSRRWALSRMAHAYCLLSSQPLRPGSPQARSTGLAARDSLRSCRLVLSKFSTLRLGHCSRRMGATHQWRWVAPILRRSELRVLPKREDRKKSRGGEANHLGQSPW